MINNTTKILAIVLTLLMTSCTVSTSSSSNFPNSNFNSPDKESRGPTGGGAGGGIIIVENNGKTQANTSYDLYLEENGIRSKIQSGKTNSDGEIKVSESSLTPEKIKKLQSGSLKVVVEISDGTSKTIAKGKITVEVDKNKEADFNLA